MRGSRRKALYISLSWEGEKVFGIEMGCVQVVCANGEERITASARGVLFYGAMHGSLHATRGVSPPPFGRTMY